MPKILTEKSNSLTYIKEDIGENKHYLGKLAGIGAEFNKPTRNGRRYPLELWKNIENSDDFKEGMSTHTIFGECDHPEDRVETSIKEIAIVLTKYEIREDEGNVYTEFHILDTPNGRILKELLDYGSQIGVSTRGLGDEIVKDGETIIDPETYCFYGWDAVVMPAVKNARPTVVESKKKSLIESFNSEIKSASSIDELKSIKRMVSKVPELDSVMESINIKLKSMNEGDNISSKLRKDLGIISEENVRLSEELDNSKASLSANNIRIKELKNLVKEYRNVTRSLRRRLQEHMVNSAELERSIYDSAKESDATAKILEQTERKLNSKSKELIESKQRFDELRKELFEVKKDLRESRSLSESLRSQLSESKSELYESETSSSNELYEMEKKIEKLRSTNKSLVAENYRLTEQIKKTTSKQVLTEKKSANELSSYKKALAEKSTAMSETLDKYLKTKCAQNGIKIETIQRLLPENYTSEDIDSIVSELADRKRRYDALPFAITPTANMRVVENLSNLSKEDKQTMAFLEETCKNT